MKLLGIDWGEAKVGLAVAEGKLAEPYKVIRYKDIATLREVLNEIIKKEGIEKVVVGISEGRSQKDAREFGENLKGLEVEIEYFDETLTTASAQELSRKAGIKRKRRRAMEDAFAAAVMLQFYLESHV